MALVFSATFFLFSCFKSSDPDTLGNNPPRRDTTLLRFTGVLPLRAEINDTITFTGRHFGKLIEVIFNGQVRAVILSKTETEVSAIVPVVYNEQVEVKAIYAYSTSDNVKPLASDSTNFNLVGVFPLQMTIDIGDIGQVAAVTDNVFYLVSNNQLYKTVDGGYAWNLMNKYSEGISNMYFIDENKGWIGLYGDNGARLYYTVDGGKNLEEKFVPATRLDGNAITGIQFSTPVTGYILTGKGDVYNTIDNANFNFSYYFTAGNLGSNYVEFGSLAVAGDQLLATGKL